jgi:hypothetical protein
VKLDEHGPGITARTASRSQGRPMTAWRS